MVEIIRKNKKASKEERIINVMLTIYIVIVSVWIATTISFRNR